MGAVRRLPAQNRRAHALLWARSELDLNVATWTRATPPLTSIYCLYVDATRLRAAGSRCLYWFAPLYSRFSAPPAFPTPDRYATLPTTYSSFVRCRLTFTQFCVYTLPYSLWFVCQRLHFRVVGLPFDRRSSFGLDAPTFAYLRQLAAFHHFRSPHVTPHA